MKIPPLPFIWRSGTVPAAPNTWTYFRRSFEWDGKSPATIIFAADPTARLFINGRVALARVMRFVSPNITCESVDISNYLKAGKNVAVVLHHWWGVPTFQRSRGGSPGFAIQSSLLKTDANWLWRNADEFLAHRHQTIGGNAQRIRFPVIMDARLSEVALHDPGYDDPRWSKAVSVRSTSWKHPVLKETPALIREEFHPVKVEAVGTVTPPSLKNAPHPQAPVSWLAKHSKYRTDISRATQLHGFIRQQAPAACLLPGSDGYVTLDFGKPLHGYLRIEILNAPAGVILDFTYGEIRQDLCSGKPVLLKDGSFDPELIVGTPFGDRITLRKGAQIIEIPEERTWRWLMITWRNASAPVVMKSATSQSSQHPVPQLGTFHSSQRDIPKLVELCLDHTKVTMSDTYVDTPGREDGQWLEDIQHRAQLAAQWFGDRTLRQVTLRHTVEQQAASGRFRVFPPEDYAEQGLQTLDWGIVWIGILYDDWMWTGETMRIRKYFPNLSRFLEVAHSQTNYDGLLVDRTCMTDIRCALRANLDAGEIESIPNAWYYGFLRQAAELARAIGKSSESKIWESRAAIVRKCFGRFVAKGPGAKRLVGEVWSPQDGVKGFGQAATVSAVFHNLLAGGMSREVLDSAFSTKDGAPPKGGRRWNNPTYAYRALRALCDHGRGAKAGRHFLERYRPYLPDGPLPEYFIPGEGQPHDPTGSHGWAAVPLVWLHDTVLGVRLLQPGGKKVSWSPVNIGWSKVSGITMTPLGPCEVQIDWNQNRFSIKLPSGCVAEIRLPVGIDLNSRCRVWKNVADSFAIG